MRKLKCLRCDGTMEFLMREKFQKGNMGPWVGNINFSMQGGFEMEVCSCTKCGRLEFFLPDFHEEKGEVPEFDDEEILQTDCDIVRVSREGIPQVRCPACGATHDFDYPKCPFCGCGS